MRSQVNILERGHACDMLMTSNWEMCEFLDFGKSSLSLYPKKKVHFGPLCEPVPSLALYMPRSYVYDSDILPTVLSYFPL